MDGFPYKYNEDLLFQNSWNRNPEVYGNFASLKENVDPSCDWNQEFARYALRWERRLEFAMENMRFFDLVRWGICSETMNKYFQSEKARRSYLKEAVFTKNKNEYAPIPQQQIGYSKDVYKQNYGWK